MYTHVKHFLTVLWMVYMVVSTCACSVLISTPPTAKFRIQGLDNKFNEYVIILDEPVNKTDVGFRISKNYTLQLDFEWLWDSATGSQTEYDSTDEDLVPPLVPWIVCNYRF